MLILPDAERAHVDFDKLRERVEQTARYGYRAADRQVEVGEFLHRDFVGGIYRRARFRNDCVSDGAIELFYKLGDEDLRFLGRRAVADGYAVDVVLGDYLFERFLGFFYLLLRRSRIYDRLIEELAARVDDSYLAARAVRGVEPEYHLAFERRLQQQRFEVALEGLYGLLGRAVEKLRPHFAFYRRLYEPVVAVLYRLVDKLVECRTFLLDRGYHACRLRIVDGDADFETVLLFAAVDGEHAVAGHCGDRLVELEIRFVYLFLFRLGGFFRIGLGGVGRQLGRDKPARFEREIAQALSHRRIVGDTLGDYIARAGNSRRGVGNVLFRVDVRRGQLIAVGRKFLRLDDIRKRLEPALDRDGRARLFLLLVRAVNVLRLGKRLGVFERDGKLVRPLALRLDRGTDLVLALLQSFKIIVPLGYGAYDLIVRRAVHLLAVARDKRNGIALVEQVDDVGAVFFLDAELLGKLFFDVHKTSCFFADESVSRRSQSHRYSTISRLEKQVFFRAIFHV